MSDAEPRTKHTKECTLRLRFWDPKIMLVRDPGNYHVRYIPCAALSGTCLGLKANCMMPGRTCLEEGIAVPRPSKHP